MNRPPLPTRDLDRIDLADPRLHAEHDLGPVWRRLRDEDPVHWQPPRGTREGFWVLTRHDDVRAVYGDAVRFTSERGNVLDALRGDGDSAGGRMVSVTDGPQHTALRRLLTRSFSPGALAATEGLIRDAARRLLRDALDRGRCDFARDVAAAIPLTAIGDLLGVPVADRPHLLAMTSSAVSSVSPDHTEADAWKAKNNILFYFAGLLEDRRAEPRDDVTGLLATARVRGRALTDDEIVFNCYSLILGGDETTRLTIVGMAYELARRPETWQALKDGRLDADRAVEEFLRWTTPSMHQGRMAVEDSELHGRRIRAGDIVTLWNVSANRDERVHADPDRLDPARVSNPHLAFGAGPHFCLGVHLARLEIKVVLEELRAMVGEIRLAGEPEPVYSNFFGGMSSLPLELVADGGARR
ncbi:cytochrome P450 [Streptomyces sp. NPDC015350]|uniref:cytochrome P450 n=1 Tax=Streptomyces sp. NPDC015350 TaxID=3364955 RepID=UPI0036F5AF81